MTRNTHGGRRKNQTGRPRHDNPKSEQVKARFTPDEGQRLDKQRQERESRAACVRRLVMAIINEKEQEMTQEFMAIKLRPESRPGWCDETEQGYSIPAGEHEIYWVIVPTILEGAKYIAYSDAKEDHPGGIVEATLADGRWATIKGVPWGDTEEEAWQEFNEYDKDEIDVWVRTPPPRRY